MAGITQAQYNRHMAYLNYASDELKSIEAIKGKTDPRLEKLCMDYAKSVLGNTIYAPWLLVYAAFLGEFKEGWIPHDYFEMIVAPRITKIYGYVSTIASLTPCVFTFPERCKMPNIASFANGLFLTCEGEVISSNEVHKYVFDRCDKVVFKTSFSMGGQGVHFLTAKDFDSKKIIQLGNGVFQEYIKQHDVFEEIVSSGVVTLRVLTVVEDSGNIRVCSAYARIPRSADTHVITGKSILLSVDMETGQFDDYAMMPDRSSVDKHPDTGTTFAGRRIPRFKECIAGIVKLHEQYRACRIIGWDVIVDKDENLQMMEWNGNCPMIVGPEWLHGPCFTGLGWENFWRK
ncbi:MAG: hypothetical protein FWF77_10305 [Defluviitaleaceae bacterium]|nr:hypothetical protein [Defluviitaleaceae bacterium]